MILICVSLITNEVNYPLIFKKMDLYISIFVKYSYFLFIFLLSSFFLVGWVFVALQGLSLVAACRLLTAMASPAAEHRI